jgi:hypothetical protein
MSRTIKLEDVISEFSEDDEVWTLQDSKSKKYVIIPDERFPGRKPVRFFLKKEDAEAVLKETRRENALLKNKKIIPIKVKLLRAARGMATDTNPRNADSFVLHGPVEVYEFVRDRY